jgi:hypothetical protein
VKTTFLRDIVRHAPRIAIAASILGGCFAAIAAPTLAPSPALPLYGQPVSVELHTAQPIFMPAIRYARNGNSIMMDFEYHGSLFGPFPPNMGVMPVPLGELAPGNYTLSARLFDMDRPGSLPTVTTANLPVVPPQEWGAYLVPKEPRAYENVEVLVKSAAFFDPRSMRATVSGNVVRVDFEYLGNILAPGGTAGMTTFASVRVGGLAPGQYRVEAWARPTTGGTSEKFFTRDFATTSQAYVVEYYHEALDHYFMAASADEIALLDAGGQGGWKRTGQRFQAWTRSSDAPPNAVPVCRFYASGPSSHFYTGDARECDGLKQYEQGARADAIAQGKPFLGWAYEGIAFYALVPQNGQCPPSTTPVYRAYNMRAQYMDSNHRFTVDPVVRGSMAGWADEGAQFCSPT